MVKYSKYININYCTSPNRNQRENTDTKYDRIIDDIKNNIFLIYSAHKMENDFFAISKTNILIIAS